MCKKFTVFLFIFALISGTVAQGVDPSLIGRWKLDEGAGLIAADSSGRGTDGTINNANGGLGPNGSVWVTDPERGIVLSFNGDDAGGTYVDAGSIPPMTADNGFTWIFWTKQDTSQGNNNDVIIGNRYGGTANLWIKFTPSFFEVGSTAAAYAIDHDNIPNGVWVHHAVVKDGTSYVYYRDGLVAGSNTITRTTGVMPFFLGGDAQGERWRGYLSDVRIYERALSAEEVVDVMLGRDAAELARDPVPAHEATDVLRDTTLSWTAGEFAATHDVYFGTVFDDVNDATRANPLNVLISQGQTAATCTLPSRLEFDQTYYWRVDEVNAAPDNTLFRGEVWSFTAESLAYTIEGVIATSNTTSIDDQGPENTVNGSGLSADGLHSTSPTAMWAGSPTPGETPYIQFEFDRLYKLHEMLVWNYNMGFEFLLGFGVKSTTVEYSENGTDWTLLGDYELAQGTSLPSYTHNTTVDFEGVAARYVRLNVNSSWNASAQSHGLSEVRFMYIPVLPSDPKPADGAAGVALDADLNWRTGREAGSHEVYLGTDPNALPMVGTTAQSTYAPASLDLDTTYAWQIIEVNTAEAISSWAGDVWSFSTQEYLVVDDFEGYSDDWEAGEAIWQTWIDGWEDNTNGSQVGYTSSPFAEQTIIHGGTQAMPLFFNNPSASSISEATRTLAPGQNWTANGIKSLSLWFNGAAGNTAGLYVKVNGTRIDYDGDADDIGREIWLPWNIDLADAGNVSNVTTLTVGVQGTGSGVVYIDDIRLYAKTPEVITPVAPDAANLAASYAFDGNANDGSGNGRNGTLIGAGITFDNDPVRGQVLSLPGGDDIYVSIGAVGISGNMPRTIACWAKADNTVIPDWTLIFGFTGNEAGQGGNGSHFNIGSLGGPGGVGAHCWGWEETIFSDEEALEWHHYAMSYDGTTISYYGDGIPMDTDPAKSNVRDLSISADRVHVGTRITQTSSFPGDVDDAVIYNVQLTDGEIAALAGRTAVLHKAF